ncbi:MAG: hypothetical protein LBI45_03735 [Bacteroidales bacterium]|jgi:hypothetical protein|nr:hypothetical protein [Bacteroidales bacterium]
MKSYNRQIFIFLVMVFFLSIPSFMHAQATFNLETGTGTGTGWSWTDPVLTINNGANITVTGTVKNGRKIEISENATANVAISNVYISGEDVVGGDGWDGCPLYLNSGANLTLTLDGDNTIKAGHYWPAISVTTNRTLTIEGSGNLDATGGWSCAGIGGGLWDNGPCGAITINSGTITIKGAKSSWIGTAGAGIGGGAAQPGGNITINGGVINAVDGENGAGMGIGNGGLYSVGTLTMNGNPIVFSNRIGDMDANNKSGGILVLGNTTFWYSSNNFSLSQNVIVPITNVLTINEGNTLTIPAGKQLINNGVIINYSQITINGTLTNNGTILNVNSGTITGTISGNPPVTTTPLSNSFDLATISLLQVGDGWILANNTCTVLDGADVTITGTAKRRIEVATNATANITLNDVSITGLGNNQTPLLVNTNATLNLTLEGNNKLGAGRSRAALQAAEKTTLTIDGLGKLIATGGTYGGAAIGGAFCEGAGTITINGGTITATSVDGGSYCSGAGIGGGGAGIIFFNFQGYGGTGGDVTINGGRVTATGPNGAAGIGGGVFAGYGGKLDMNGNAVVFASALTNNENSNTNINGVVKGILFNGYYGLCYKSVTIDTDFEFPADFSLTVPSDAGFAIPENKTFTYNGSINNQGTIKDDGGTLILNGTLSGNKILFENKGKIIDTVQHSELPIEIGYLFQTNSNTGLPSYTLETGCTGEGILNNELLTVEKLGTFIIGLVTAETYYYTESEKVTSGLVVVPIIGIENLSSDKFTACTNNSRLYVNGLQEGKTWSVYNTMGALIYRGVARDVKDDIPLRAKGVFIVHSEGQSIKVIHN